MINRLPKITIITPSYNQAAFIERTIESVLSQQYPNLEYIIMDGRSTDGTIDILKKYEGKLRWISEKDEGQTDAVNKGIKQATGEIIAYLNSDDVYEPGALFKVADYFSTHHDVKWVTGRCRIINEQDQEVRKLITGWKNFLLRHFSYSLLLVTNPISQPATFWRKSIVDEFGLLDKQQHFVMDYEYWLRIGRKYSPAIIDEYLARFRVYAASKTSSSFLTSFKHELNIARKYSHSSLLNLLHNLNYLTIAASYTMLSVIGRVRRNP